MNDEKWNEFETLLSDTTDLVTLVKDELLKTNLYLQDKLALLQDNWKQLQELCETLGIQMNGANNQ